ncbi:hypothetical protein BP5796_00236 [Coleophoma crateriformis]|uniref:C3H1-type domain-containing protein n=1 Tax=Coleophoma crateriformis TaxID=565419 RepID=A0A3D8T7D2_9HELO|nr:hypothetical protein BP5796_00236 [Coleophoma crateriformis]
MTTPREYFEHRADQLKAYRDAESSLIADMLGYYSELEKKLLDENALLRTQNENLQLDLQDSHSTRRELQKQSNLAAQVVQSAKVEINLLQNRNPYVIALIDGDGVIFNSSFVSQGIEGGKKAATALRNLVLEQCHDTELTEEIEVIAKVCTNITGLINAFTRDGGHESAVAFKDFTLGFTQGKASFDFVDVGPGKERADSKIKALTRWNLRNHNCKQILLGISHDAGYAPFLDEIGEKHKITIIKGPPTVPELIATGIQILDFSELFRTEKLINRLSNGSNNNAVAASTWAGITSATPPPAVINIKSSVKTNSTKASPVLVSAMPAWSPGPRGLDEPLKQDLNVLDKVKNRTGNDKLCNNYFLRGYCPKGDGCNFVHDHDITSAEMTAIAYLTRLNPCTNQQYCEDDKCIYGHHCPSVSNGECKAYGCRFTKDQHPPGTFIRRPKGGAWE